MAYSDAAKNLMLDALGDAGTWISLHDGDPGASGANELSGGSPAYSRQQVIWDAASGGSMGIPASETFAVPAGADVSHFGVWSASSAGTFYGGGQLSATESFVAQGEYALTAANLDLNG